MTPNTANIPLRRLASALLSLALVACDTPPTAVDRGFGSAVKQAQTQQTLSPTTHPCMHTMGPTGCPMAPMAPMKGMTGMTGMNSPMHDNMRERMGEHHRLPPGDSDGVSALATVTRYQDSFKSPPAPAPVFNIGLGSGNAR